MKRSSMPTLPPMNTTLATADGLTLHLREWPRADACGTVLIVHGLGEHIGRYERVAGHLNEWGWHVVGHDQRGHGASAGARGRLAHPDSLLVDLAQVIDAVRANARGPLVLLGHSMGGLVASRFVAGGLQGGPAPAWFRSVDALMLSSPALDLGLGGAQKLLLSVLGLLAPEVALGNGLNPDWISRDPAVVKAYVDDPLVHDRVTPRLVRFMKVGGEFVRAHAAAWQVPTLLLYAGSDRCVAPAGSAAFAAAAPRSRVTAQAFEPMFHEIFNEPGREEVFAVLGGWLSARRGS
jgi:alpha-beta hydrolase superfamily lysophospholipase